jgi:hypothetical protein
MSVTYPPLRALVLLAFLMLPASSLAGLCGDDVNGVRVGCACGDFVVSNTVLVSSDPVVTERCSTDGLIVQANPSTTALTLDLAGLSITGNGVGIGILVSYGGRDGAVISGGPDTARPGQVVGFGSGLRMRTQRTLSVLRNIDFRGHQTDGVVLRSLNTKLENVGAFSNGRDGLRVAGRKLQIEDVVADANGRHQIELSSTSAAESAAAAGLSEGVHARERLPLRREPPSMEGQ